MIIIRLNQKKKKLKSMYDVVVIEKRRSSHGGKFIDKLGTLNRKENYWKNKMILIDMFKFVNWLLKGAFLSPFSFKIVKMYTKYLEKTLNY